ncbi:manganese efflux pump MntP [Cellulosilyticum ruminicola]|uniref:manganese efflux pump MntP n=1 Tax=Cellulosilyticum ruminicola TaxID=425254 RepID=UPI0006D04748|nr:manganese efflux pump [Cellulosilyticum ruminicola]
MRIWEIILIGLGLSMDAVAVSMTNGMIYKGLTKDKVIGMPVFFGGFQGFMPLLGFLLGGLISGIITQYANILVFLILGFIGSKMLIDVYKDYKNPEAEEKVVEGNLTYKTLLLQAIATSIDAFTVGIGFSAIGVNVVYASSIIALTTGVCSLVAIFVGKKFGNMFESKSTLIGGIILVLIAIKSLIG